MQAFKKILVGTAGLAALVGIAGPAAAQYYPNNGYGYQPDVGQQVGQAINGVIGAMQYGGYPYGNYGYNQSYYGMNGNDAVNRCARAVEVRLNGGGYQRWGYNNNGRVTGILDVQPRNNGALRVHGVASTYSGYGYGQPNMSFTCRVSRYGQIEDLTFDTGYRWNGPGGYGRRW